MNTRQDYLEGRITHREYYSQFVTDSIKNVVLNLFVRTDWTLDEVKGSYKNDPHFNFIPLMAWDRASLNISGNYSLAEKVCILKETARQIIENQ